MIVLIEEYLKTNYQYKFVIKYLYEDLDSISISLSLAEISHRIMWKRLRQIKQEQAIVTARVIRVREDKSLILDIEGIQGLIDSSETSDFYINKPMEQLIGCYLDVEIHKISDNYHRDFLILKFANSNRQNLI